MTRAARIEAKIEAYRLNRTRKQHSALIRAYKRKPLWQVHLEQAGGVV